MISVLRNCNTVTNVCCKYINYTPLTVRGVAQAYRLNGSYDIIFSAQNKSCIETLQKSKIQYKYFRDLELLNNPSIDLCKYKRQFYEDYDYIEEYEKYEIKINKLKKYLNLDMFQNKNILLITNAEFIWHLSKKNSINEVRHDIYGVKQEEYSYGKWVKEGEIIKINNFITNK